jgi:hypothetical protein
MNDELEGMRKEPVVPYFKLLSRHSPGGNEEKLHSAQLMYGRDSNLAPPKYKSEALPPDPTCSVTGDEYQS